MRGTIRPTTREEAVARAKSMIGASIRYRLRDHNGGSDPFSSDPASHWDGGVTCDCSGFVAWCLGYDRYQPKEFPGGWINTNSMIASSLIGDGTWFGHPRPTLLPGDLIVYGSRVVDGKRRVGHVGIITGLDPMRATHCSAGNDRKFGYAVAETDDKPWRGKPKRYLRYLRAA